MFCDWKQFYLTAVEHMTLLYVYMVCAFGQNIKGRGAWNSVRSCADS